MNPVRIVVFAKAPLPGLAKSRLIPALGAQGAAGLARRMLDHTVAQALAAGAGAVELCVTPAPSDEAWRTQARAPGVAWTAQGEGDLGERMARATRRVTAAGESILLIGTDCPALDAAQLRRCAEALQQFDATLVPTMDGGYVLLGVRHFDPSLFTGIEWSTGSVAAATRLRMAALGWGIQEQPAVHDIDRPEDLQWLPEGWPESMLTQGSSPLEAASPRVHDNHEG